MGALLNSEAEDGRLDREAEDLHGARVELLNSLSEAQARLELLKCCGSETWARILVNRRPFTNLNDLLLKADEVWWSLKPHDWLEAFSSHPRIGEQKAARASPAESVSWSKQEQASISSAAQDTMQSLA
jgi:OHCU decarboxylase